MAFEIDWDSTMNDFYNYGSTIEYKEGTVLFKNELLSPGAVIVRWKSNTNYQRDRTLLQLPLLIKNTHYRVQIEAEMIPKNSMLIRLDFFDRFEKLIDTEVLSGRGGSFIYPCKAHTYSLSLIGIGIREFKFKKLLLYEDSIKKINYKGRTNE